jgi:hypothetical protein
VYVRYGWRNWPCGDGDQSKFPCSRLPSSEIRDSHETSKTKHTKQDGLSEVMPKKKLAKAAPKPSKGRQFTPAQYISTAILVGVLCIVSYVSQIILHPVYGSVGTSLHHYNVLFTVAMIAPLLTFLGINGVDAIPPQNWKGIASILICAPLILPRVFWGSGSWGPIFGPIFTQTVMTWPCVFLVSHHIAKVTSQLFGKPYLRQHSAFSLGLALGIAILLTAFTFISEKAIFGPLVSPVNGIMWSRFKILLYLGMFMFIMDTIPFLSADPKLIPTNLVVVLVAAGSIVFIALNRPHVVTGVSPGLVALLPPEYTYLDRRESVTGMLSVVENIEAGYRVLKCDHSLLGGLWTGIKRRELANRGISGMELDRRSVDEAESVYSAFLLQEAVRLIQRPRWREKALILYTLPAFKS